MNFDFVFKEIFFNEINELYEFRKSVLSETKFLVTSLEELMDFKSFKKYVEFYIENELRKIFIAKLENKIIGEIDIMIHERKRMRHVAEYGISVLREFRGMGIGKKLIQIAEEWVFKNGVKRIQLEVIESNLIAINLYIKLGYKIEGRKKKAVNLDGNYVDLLIMAKVKE
ncbi:GCN5 family acetyltransferase [Thermosipho sp. 1063]|uniref:GNAT family N-acetyltransferase n=1 Tax=unclassified Thermosipho (in: thermotogales) TaxID=2676525 RepID=UPI000949482B|nr:MULTISPECIES: GNAT family N-acetyltransferase [unclassified Thermosipho (in: thermotogales)]ANQ52996.1 acetyltransferase [Thermosipho sp. 1070]APT71443.1 GCN5 family acetyltransferase [Thermosipho sp. 1063]OOC45519.1 GCN5 family acetyltransferase [Thermosipho sp. 1074]